MKFAVITFMVAFSVSVTQYPVLLSDQSNGNSRSEATFEMSNAVESWRVVSSQKSAEDTEIWLTLSFLLLYIPTKPNNYTLILP
jgi:hypothetical protein